MNKLTYAMKVLKLQHKDLSRNFYGPAYADLRQLQKCNMLWNAEQAIDSILLFLDRERLMNAIPLMALIQDSKKWKTEILREIAHYGCQRLSTSKRLRNEYDDDDNNQRSVRYRRALDANAQDLKNAMNAEANDENL